MSVQGIFGEVKEVCINLKRVKIGEKASPGDYNQLVDCIEKLLELSLQIGLGGALPYWAPILDVGKLDYMIVGEPRKDVTNRRIPEKIGKYFEIKPVYGYLSEDDMKFLTMSANMLSKYLDMKEELPILKFGDRLTSDYWNQLTTYIWKISEDSGLPYRFISLESDTSASWK